MSSLDRPLAGPVLVHDLAREIEALRSSLGRADARTARTLVKDGPLRVTLIVMGPGASIPEHHAEGPISVQPLEGTIRFRTADGEQRLSVGSVLSAGAGVPHSVTCDEAAAFLLTVALASSD